MRLPLPKTALTSAVPMDTRSSTAGSTKADVGQSGMLATAALGKQGCRDGTPADLAEPCRQLCSSTHPAAIATRAHPTSDAPPSPREHHQ